MRVKENVYGIGLFGAGAAETLRHRAMLTC
jgi:hypothetical protein